MLVAVLALALAGCKVAVHSRAHEASANEVLGVLLDAGIDAEKLAVDEKTFDVEVGRGDLARALAVLRTNGLPRESSESLGQLFKKEGLVSTPAEERVRYVYGVSQELEKTIGRIDGVVLARVHIVIPANDPLSDNKKFSSSSVFVKYRPPLDPNTIGPLVRTLVMRAIEGMEQERVSVAFVAAEPANTAPVRLVNWLGIKVASDSLVALNVFAAAAVVSMFGAAAVLARGRRSERAPRRREHGASRA